MVKHKKTGKRKKHRASPMSGLSVVKKDIQALDTRVSHLEHKKHGKKVRRARPVLYSPALESGAVYED